MKAILIEEIQYTFPLADKDKAMKCLEGHRREGFQISEIEEATAKSEGSFVARRETHFPKKKA